MHFTVVAFLNDAHETHMYSKSYVALCFECHLIIDRAMIIVVTSTLIYIYFTIFAFI